MKKIKFKIHGLKCENCPIFVEKALNSRAGVIRARVDRSSSKGVVFYDGQEINEADIYKTIEDIGGFQVEKLESVQPAGEETTNYSNPDSLKEIKPPISQLNENDKIRSCECAINS